MMETTATVIQQNLPAPKTRRNIVYATLCFCALLIGYLIVQGTDQNSLHVSALGWAFTLMITTVVGFVFGVVLDNWNFVRYGETKSS